ncbi:hypothetical protein [Actinoplanes regularis]|uniref:Uncharacterized protein n=1 Tax=Actinoplanes regularis TaxID=52697 RepID=A0A239IYS5_9ACTN|nr:hypothetical protein [Actinoplanes regularis]GIE91614.1 hypothetical protein Are01nite_80940 [Actinoplanes regularis]SNS98143.1 hypothetical protein SAMN06264365_13154 [Actinoplanes regularis]
MTGPKVLLENPVEVGRGQLYLTSDESLWPTAELAFAGQHNGLCGAAQAGALYLMTGLRHGLVGFTVELHDRKPALDDKWTEVVEVSLTNPFEQMVLSNFEGDAWIVPLPTGVYRVRYCAAGMQAGWDLETNDAPTPIDCYLLAVWPAAPADDVIIRQSSAAAAYWHHANGDGPADEASTGRLAQVETNLGVIRELHAGLISALACCSDDVHRSVARWAALQALSEAGIRDSSALRDVVADLERGVPVSPPFDDEITVMGEPARLFGQTPVQPVAGLYTEGRLPMREWYALVAVSATAIPDSLDAVFYALTQTIIAHGPDHAGDLLEGLYKAFPLLRD